jgi:hypothetical protein
LCTRARPDGAWPCAGYLREPASVIALDLLQGESAPTVAAVLQAAPALVDVLTCPVAVRAVIRRLACYPD